MKKHSIGAEVRTLIGRKVKQLRKLGLVPATVYGKNISSLALSISADLFEKLLQSAGESGLIELTVDKTVRPVLISSVQRHPVNDALLHVEFHQVNLKEKVHAKVPLKFIGESEAVNQHIGVLLTVLGEVEVEALPSDLPEYIEVDISRIGEVGQELNVKDLLSPSGIIILTDPDLTVANIGALVTKAAEVEAAAAEAVAPAVSTETTGAASPEAPAAETTPAPRAKS